MNTPVLYGKRIILRDVRESDIDDRLRIGRHHEFVHNCGGDTMPAPSYPERAVWERWFSGFHKDDEYNWVIELNGKCIGTAGFHHISKADHSAVYRIGIFDVEHLSEGLGTEVTKLLVDWGFRVMGWHRVELRVLDYNKRAIRCYEKCGFRVDGVLRENAFIDGRYFSDVVMSILKREWN